MKVKVFIAMIAVALGGLIIWSCTQDEMENGQVTYRYSAEEIATLRAMAEKYGVPEVVFPTESSNKLFSIKGYGGHLQNIWSYQVFTVHAFGTSRFYCNKHYL